MSEESPTNKTIGQTKRYMAVVERALYAGAKTTKDLQGLLATCESYSLNSKTLVSERTVQSVIRKLKQAYLQEFGISEKESIRVSRSEVTPKYILGEKARKHLIYPEEIFYSKTDRDKLNLLLRVGEYFSLPMEAFLKKDDLLKEGAEELFGDHIELKMRPFLSKVFADVFDAVENRHVITFKHEALTQARTPSRCNDFHVTPFYLKSYANKWYLIGHVKGSQNRWTVFALDRMSDVKVVKEATPYSMDTKIIERFYKNVIGFFVPPNPDGSFPKSEKELDIKSIVLTMKDDKGAFFLEKNPIHKSQVRLKQNRLQFSIECLDNVHLYQALLRIVDDIQWIEPSVVRNRLISKLDEAQKTLKP